MMNGINELIGEIKDAFPISSQSIRGESMAFITTDKEHAVPLLTHVRDIKGFTHLVLLTAVDWLERGVFQLTYILNNPSARLDLGVRVEISREQASMHSAHHLWATIATYQRELKEMFGIDFPGSPRVDEPFILEGWDGIPPYRRDFDTATYSEETFFPRPGRETHDPAEYMKKKLYPGKP
jgi:NADH-quinone oxidoreductase subunit C